MSCKGMLTHTVSYNRRSSCESSTQAKDAMWGLICHVILILGTLTQYNVMGKSSYESKILGTLTQYNVTGGLAMSL